MADAAAIRGDDEATLLDDFLAREQEFKRLLAPHIAAQEDVARLSPLQYRGTKSQRAKARESLAIALGLLKSQYDACQEAHTRMVLSDSHLAILRDRRFMHHPLPNLSSAAMRLPVEMLLQILGFVEGDDLRATILLSHVNRYWRFLLLNAPFLWTRLDSRLGGSFARVVAHRSRDLPLDIHISQYGYHNHLQKSQYQPDVDPSYEWRLRSFVKAAVEVAPRWSNFCLDASIPRVYEIAHECMGIFGSPVGPQSLNRVTIRTCPNFIDYYDDLPAQPDITVPIKALVLEGLPHCPLGYFSSSLVTLDLGNMGSYSVELFEILKQATCLRNLYIEGHSSSTTGDETIVSRHLETLVVRMNAGFGQIFQCVQMPALRILRVESRFDGDGFLALPDSAPALVELSIASLHNQGTWPWNGRHCPTLPCLQQLSLESTCIDEDSFTALALLPSLRRLALRTEACVTKEALQELVLRRIRDDRPPFERVMVAWCEQIQEHDMQLLQGIVPDIEWVLDDGETDEEYGESSADEESETDSDIDAEVMDE